MTAGSATIDTPSGVTGAIKAVRYWPCNPTGAASADAGDCFRQSGGRVSCLPGLINIGVQKAGTGELQNWLAAHPSVMAHGGEVHFFDTLKLAPRRCTAATGASVRLRYAKFMWEHRSLDEESVRGRLVFEKTPAYFDLVAPRLIACAVPSARLLVMLRLPAERAHSAYAMCQREFGARWCKPPFTAALRGVLRGGGGNGSSPSLDRRALRRMRHGGRQLGRVLEMGHYSAFVGRWLDVFGPARLRLLWLEEFKRDPFGCLRAIEAYAGLPTHDFRAVARRNAAGYWVVGASKSDSASTSNAVAAAERRHDGGAAAAEQAEAMRTLRAYYAPWQQRLTALVRGTNVSLLSEPAVRGRAP